MISRRQPSGQTADLNTLLRHARGYAQHMMETAGSVPPTLMAETPEGVMMFVPGSIKDEATKDQFANAGRLFAIGYKASAVAMIMESWATFAKRPGQPLPKTPPSQSPDREEVVVIMAETRESRAQQFLFIGRDARGKFTGFGTSLVPQFDRLEGRFAQMMPPKDPGDQEAQLARTLLKTLGVVVEGHGQEPMWN